MSERDSRPLALFPKAPRTYAKFILRGTNVLGMARAMQAVIDSLPTTDWSDHGGIRVDGRFYGVSFGKSSITIWQQPHDPPDSP